MNKQITEDYVSYEIAVLLKEKGFDEKCSRWYVANEPQEGIVEKGFGENQFYINAPTHQMAMKWLREVHNIHISINVGCDVDNKNYIFYIPTIVKLNNKSVEYIDPFCEDEDEFDSNEKAIETALLYVLKNLI